MNRNIILAETPSQTGLRHFLLSQHVTVQIKKALAISIPIAFASAFAYSYLVPSRIIFTIQLNDPLISSSSNAPKLNALLGNTKSDPTLTNYLVSQQYLCKNLAAVPGFSTTRSRLTGNINKRCSNNLPLAPYVRATFAKGERYEDLQAIRFTLQSYDTSKDSLWIKNLARFYSNQSRSFAKIRIDAVNQAIVRSEIQASIDSNKLRNSLFNLISKYQGPLDEKYKTYSSQLVALDSLSASYAPKEAALVASLAAQLNLAPKRVLPLIETLSGLNRDDSEQLLKSLQDINVRLVKLRAGSTKMNPEYIKTLQLRTSLISQISSKVPNFAQIAKLQPNPAALVKTIETTIELQTLKYQIAENQRLTTSLLVSLKAISSELPQYILLQSKISAQDEAISSAAKDNENLKIELNKLVGTWDVLEGPYIKKTQPAIAFLMFSAGYSVLLFLMLFRNTAQRIYSHLATLLNFSSGKRS